MNHDPIRDFEILLLSRYGVLLVDSADEDRAMALVERAAASLQLPLFVWRRGMGLQRIGASGPIYGTRNPGEALAHVLASQFPALYVFQGLGPEFENPEVADLVREAARKFVSPSCALVLTGGGLDLPESLRNLVGVVRLPALTRQDYEGLLQQVLRDVSSRIRVTVTLSAEERDRLLGNLQGLTLAEAEKLLTRSIVEDGRLTAEDIRRVAAAKRDMVERDRLLEFCTVGETLEEIADLSRLKGWLEKRRLLIENPERAEEFGLEFPRGVLLVGVPGCGKSLCAKAVAAAWGLPLVRLDPSVLYDKYVGGTEENMRKAISSADRFAPLVLWIDEIEKAFAAGGEEDGGTSRRVLGTFITWLQERRGDVFVVATANDVHRLPAELLRKGRFDEVFFVDLPDEASRAVILGIHLRKRKQDPERFDLATLATVSEGYSGGDLEQVVVSALYTAFSLGRPLNTELLMQELEQTPSIASMARERIAFIRDWAKGRAVPAN